MGAASGATSQCCLLEHCKSSCMIKYPPLPYCNGRVNVFLCSCKTMHLGLQVVRGALLLLQGSDGNFAKLGAARAALGKALAPVTAPSDAHAIAHALLGQVEVLRRKPDNATGHIQQARSCK